MGRHGRRCVGGQGGHFRLLYEVEGTTCVLSSDVVLGLGPWSLVVLKDQISVLGPVLGLEGHVLVNITDFVFPTFSG